MSKNTNIIHANLTKFGEFISNTNIYKCEKLEEIALNLWTVGYFKHLSSTCSCAGLRFMDRVGTNQIIRCPRHMLQCIITDN